MRSCITATGSTAIPQALSHILPALQKAGRSGRESTLNLTLLTSGAFQSGAPQEALLHLQWIDRLIAMLDAEERRHHAG